MDTKGETIINGELVCVRDGKIVRRQSRPIMSLKNPAPRFIDLQVSKVTCAQFRLNKMYANMYIKVCSGHTGCGKLLHGKVKSWQYFYFDGKIQKN